MKSFKLSLLFIMISMGLYAQIDPGLLLQLTNATTAEMTAIASPATGVLLFNTTDQNVYQYNGSSWVLVGGSSTNWGITGNTGTNSATDFIGTTDAQDFVMSSNNTERIRLVQDRNQVLINQASVFNSHPLVIRANGSDIIAFQDNTGNPDWHFNLLAGGLNFVESGVADYRLFLQNGGNVGINTSSPSEELDVDGNARFRNISAADETDDILSADANGVLQRSRVNYGARFTNVDITTNLNVNNTVAPIFGAQDYNDDATNLYVQSGTTLTIREAGRYDIRANLSLVGINSGSNRQRTNVNARITVNGAVVGALAASGYIRWANGQDHSSIHISEILNLSANDVVRIVTYREANTGTVRFSALGESSFMINKLK